MDKGETLGALDGVSCATCCKNGGPSTLATPTCRALTFQPNPPTANAVKFDSSRSIQLCCSDLVADDRFRAEEVPFAHLWEEGTVTLGYFAFVRDCHDE